MTLVIVAAVLVALFAVECARSWRSGRRKIELQAAREARARAERERDLLTVGEWQWPHTASSAIAEPAVELPSAEDQALAAEWMSALTRPGAQTPAERGRAAQTPAPLPEPEAARPRLSVIHGGPGGRS